jgi:NAD(P)-dependent dehydrogenase (short-subunit alcohol dehydrogenase family)
VGTYVEGMTTPQHKIGSGFGAQSTADDVLRGIDLSGKLAVVTGGYSGIGLETTRALVRAGARVIVPARRPGSAREALGDGVEVDELDLADLASVHGFAERLLASGRAIDIVINSAGVMACPETRVGPGWEAQLATNHLGHYALVNQLWPAISRGGARVVAVSSAGHRRAAIRWDDVMFEHGYDKWQAYGQAKTANVLFAVHLDALARDAGVRAFALHPGGIRTPLQRHLPKQEMVDAGWIDETGNWLNPAGSRRPSRAPQRRSGPRPPRNSTAWAASTARIAISPNRHPTTRSSPGGVRSYAVDLEQAARLWSLSAELTGVNAFRPA